MENKFYGILSEDCINPSTGEVLGIRGDQVTDRWLDNLPSASVSITFNLKGDTL